MHIRTANSNPVTVVWVHELSCALRQDMMCQGEALVTVLRLLVLMSVTAGGVPKKHFDALRREILHTYGHENVITLSNLQDAGEPE